MAKINSPSKNVSFFTTYTDSNGHPHYCIATWNAETQRISTPRDLIITNKSDQS